jgi:hypothetical protein
MTPGTEIGGIPGLGQLACWREVVFESARSGGARTTSQGLNSTPRARTGLDVVSVSSTVMPGGPENQRLVQLRLRNLCGQSVRIAGASSTCRPIGCWAPLNLPRDVAPYGEVVIGSEASWSTTPESPMSVALYVAWHHRRAVHVDLLPASASIVLEGDD